MPTVKLALLLFLFSICTALWICENYSLFHFLVPCIALPDKWIVLLNLAWFRGLFAFFFCPITYRTIACRDKCSITPNYIFLKAWTREEKLQSKITGNFELPIAFVADITYVMPMYVLYIFMSWAPMYVQLSAWNNYIDGTLILVFCTMLVVHLYQLFKLHALVVQKCLQPLYHVSDNP